MTNRLMQHKAYVFVYGTLRQRDHPMRRVLDRHGIYAGRGTFQGRLYDLGRYPGAVRSSGKRDRIVGEIYKLQRPIEALKVLDEYEGRLFLREAATISLKPAETITAWIYLYRGRVEQGRRIPSGDYLAHLDNR
jgi:gamma-glutamylcyclotransferase (GGCT)/AIG2-like uncharacterized protein YtfP